MKVLLVYLRLPNWIIRVAFGTLWFIPVSISYFNSSVIVFETQVRLYFGVVFFFPRGRGLERVCYYYLLFLVS